MSIIDPVRPSERVIRLSTMLLAVLMSTSTYAHNVFVNSHQSPTEPFTVVNLGYGHELPIESFLVTDSVTVELQDYRVHGPDNSVTDLDIPVPSSSPAIETPTKLRAQPGSVGAYMLHHDKALGGTYQVSAKSEPRYFTRYKDGGGKTQIRQIPMNEVLAADSNATVDQSYQFNYFAKTVFALEKWSVPEPVGHTLEIIPQTDLTVVRPGELVKFKVLFNGRPVRIVRATVGATNRSFAAGDGPKSFALSSYITDGIAQFTFPHGGQWYLSSILDLDTSSEASLSHMQSKVKKVVHRATLTFEIEPH